MPPVILSANTRRLHAFCIVPMLLPRGFGIVCIDQETRASPNMGRNLREFITSVLMAIAGLFAAAIAALIVSYVVSALF